MIITMLILLLIFLDQFSKFLAVSFLKGNDGIVIIQDFFRLYYLENRGAAFGILQNSRLFFIIVTILVSIFLIYLLFFDNNKVKGFNKIALLFILSGTIGNFIDRIRLGYVIDFLSFKIFNYNFAIFNIADSLIVVGTFILIINIIRSKEAHGQ